MSRGVLVDDPVLCGSCQKPATCFGTYEGDGVWAFACDECCGHGCEDGWCWRLDGPGLEGLACYVRDLEKQLREQTNAK